MNRETLTGLCLMGRATLCLPKIDILIYSLGKESVYYLNSLKKIFLQVTTLNRANFMVSRITQNVWGVQLHSSERIYLNVIKKRNYTVIGPNFQT